MQGFAISILNPKILIWFAAIFSQFIEISSTNFVKLGDGTHCFIHRWVVVHYINNCSYRIWIKAISRK